MNEPHAPTLESKALAISARLRNDCSVIMSGHDYACHIADVLDALALAPTAEEERAHAEGYRQCTRDVVAWLDQQDWPETLWLKIERGKHIGAATKGQS